MCDRRPMCAVELKAALVAPQREIKRDFVNVLQLVSPFERPVKGISDCVIHADHRSSHCQHSFSVDRQQQ